MGSFFSQNRLSVIDFISESQWTTLTKLPREVTDCWRITPDVLGQINFYTSTTVVHLCRFHFNLLNEAFHFIQVYSLLGRNVKVIQVQSSNSLAFIVLETLHSACYLEITCYGDACYLHVILNSRYYFT